MSNEYYNIYKEKNLRLAESFLIHFRINALAMNEKLYRLNEEVDENDPLSWRYYHNIAGNYHFIDNEIKVISHDTLEEIVFSKENLEIHRGTKNDYLNNPELVRDLISRHKEQSLLIKGILNPVDPQIALNSKDGTILHYDKSLVESNEIDLIDEIQGFVYRFQARKNVNRHSAIDELSPAAFMMILYGFLPGVISNVRKSKCLTRQAHTYHIREYLRSNGRLDKYIDILNKEQLLYLYKNIKYIRKNAGKQEVLDELVENLMTSIGLPLSTYDLKHERSNDEDNVPVSYFYRQAINFDDLYGNNNRHEIDDVLERQFEVAKFNEQFSEDEKEKIIKLSPHADSGLKTKILESDMLDLGEGSPYTLERSLIDYWFYLSSKGLYTSYVTIPNPKGTEDISLDVRDASTLALYCALRSRGIESDVIPMYSVKAVRRIELPSWDQVRSVAIKNDAVIDKFIDYTLSRNMEIQSYSSVLAFREAASKLHYRLQEHRLSTGFYSNPLKVISARNAVNQLYLDLPIEMPIGNFSTWLVDKGLDLSDLETNDYIVMYDSIVKECIGRPDNQKTLADIQKGIVDLISNLSSYNVQFISKINESPIEFTDKIPVAPMTQSTGLNIEDYVLRNRSNVDSILCGLKLSGSVSFKHGISADLSVKSISSEINVNRTRTIDLVSNSKYSGYVLRNSNKILDLVINEE